jgi:hypothetical protein
MPCRTVAIRAVDWPTLASTIVGAAIGIAATTLADRSRWKREQTAGHAQLRRQAYATYLAALIRAHEAMRAAALGEYSSAELKEAAIQEAFRSADPYVRRYEMALLAPPDVIEPAVQAFRRVRGIRDLLVSGVTADFIQYRKTQRDYYASIEAVSDAMRADLGISPLGFPPVDPLPGPADHTSTGE